MTERVTLMRGGLLGTDLLAASLAATVGAMVAGLPAGKAVFLVGSLVVSWPLVAFVAGLYSVDELRNWASGIHEIPRLLFGVLLLSWPVEALLSGLGANAAPRAAVAASAALAVFSAVGRALTRACAHRLQPLRQRGVIVGSGHTAEQVARRLQEHGELGVEPIGIVDDEPDEPEAADLPVLGEIDELERILPRQSVDRVIISFAHAPYHRLLSCIRVCRDQGVAVDVVPRLYEALDGARPVDSVRGLPLLSIGVPRLSGSARVAKRTLDVVGAMLISLVLLPLLVAIAIAIKLESRGPVFFRQTRAGRGGEPFGMLKFRTMYADAEQRKPDLLAANEIREGVMFKIRCDPRVTTLGRILRRLSLDEMPQLLNVLRAEMSLVGPRPLVLPEVQALGEAWQTRRLDLRPGMTGAWQVGGRSTSASGRWSAWTTSTWRAGRWRATSRSWPPRFRRCCRDAAPGSSTLALDSEACEGSSSSARPGRSARRRSTWWSAAPISRSWDSRRRRGSSL
jgi:exopolysaccharide biosynthesis polyprenyl glycosylphosphotransferase